MKALHGFPRKFLFVIALAAFTNFSQALDLPKATLTKSTIGFSLPTDLVTKSSIFTETFVTKEVSLVNGFEETSLGVWREASLGAMKACATSTSTTCTATCGGSVQRITIINEASGDPISVTVFTYYIGGKQDQGFGNGFNQFIVPICDGNTPINRNLIYKKRYVTHQSLGSDPNQLPVWKEDGGVKVRRSNGTSDCFLPKGKWIIDFSPISNSQDGVSIAQVILIGNNWKASGPVFGKVNADCYTAEDDCGNQNFGIGCPPEGGCVSPPNISVTSDPVCYGQQPTINATFTVEDPFAGYGSIVYELYKSGTSTLVATNSTGVFTITETLEPNTYSYYVTPVRIYNDGPGNGANSYPVECPGPSVDVTVTINPKPSASISSTGSPVCKDGTSPVITFTGSGGTAPYVFTYSINGASSLTVTTSGGSSTVTVTAPTSSAGTYTYTLSGVSDANCSGTATQSTVVVVSPKPSASISSTGSPVCKDGTSPVITFTGSGGTAPYVFTYSINGASSLTVTTSGGSSTVTVTAPTSSAGTYTYTLSGVSDANCSGTATQSTVVVVSPKPSASISSTGSPVCKDGTSPVITFTGSGGTAPYVFTYSINGASSLTVTTSGGSSTVTVTAPTSSAGTYTYTLSGVSDANCSGTATQSTVVVVSPKPSASISSTGSPVCKDGTSPVITFTGSGGTAPYVFTYSINGASSLTVTTSGGSSTVTVTAPTSSAGTYTYTLSGVSDANCSGTATQSTVVVVSPKPSASISSTGSPVCKDGTSPVITFTGSGGTAPYVFTYSINGASSLTVTTSGGSSTVTVTAPTSSAGTYTYTLSGVSDANCSGTATQSTVVVVSPKPSASISSTGSPVCKDGTSPVITFTGSGGTAPYVFTYSINGASSLTVTTSGGSSTVTVTAPTSSAGTYTYTLSGVSDANCSGTATQSTVVVVSPKPSASISSTGSPVCKDGTSPVITFTGSGGTAPYVFTYSINGASSLTVTTSGGSSTVTVTAPTSSAGTYTYTLSGVSDANCSGTATQSTVVVVNELPIVAANPVSVCSGSSVTLSGTTNGSSDSWSIVGAAAGSTISSTTFTAGTVTSTTYVQVSHTATSSVGCVKSSTTTVTINPLPSFDIAASDADICVGESTTLSSTLGGGTWSIVSGGGLLSPTIGGVTTYSAVDLVENAEGAVIRYVVTNGNGCTNSKTISIEFSYCDAFCTYSQGFYGNAGGFSCGQVIGNDYDESNKINTIYRMRLAFAKGAPLGYKYFGVNERSFKLQSTDFIDGTSTSTTSTTGLNKECPECPIFKILPGGGTPRALSSTGGFWTTSDGWARGGPLTEEKSNGTTPINNNLLAQAITMWFNVHSSPNELGNWKLPPAADGAMRTVSVTTVSVNCSDISSNGNVTQVSSSAATSTYTFPAKLAEVTVQGILDLADLALGGSLPATVTLQDVHEALGTLVDLFHGCKVVSSVAHIPTAANKGTVSTASSNVNNVAINKDVQVKAFPNPYTDQITFTVSVKNAGKGSLVLYNNIGQRIANVFEGDMQANSTQTIRYSVPVAQRKSLVYVFRQNGNTNTGHLISGK